MFAILITGICMAVLSAVFWGLEAKACVDAVRAVEKGKEFGPLKEIIYSLRVIACIPKALPLGLDIVCTVWLTGAFGFTGMIGGVIGLSISNVISLFIMYYSRKSKVQS